MPKNPPDIIGVSNYIWNFELSKTILKCAKEKCRETVTVMGGPNIIENQKIMTQFMRDVCCDYYVSGDGEHPFKSLVGSILKSGTNQIKVTEDPEVHSIWYLDKLTNEAVFKNVLHTIRNLDEIPSPFQNGMVDGFFKEGLIPMIETVRGCPFKCTYCVWGNEHTVSKYSIERVKLDIDYCRQKATGDLLMINDANFGLFLKRDLEIAQFLRNSKDAYNWPNSVIVNWGQVKSENALLIAKILKDMCLFRQSSQSMNPTVLKNIKRNNISSLQWQKNIHFCKDHGIESFGEFILMLPEETFESYINAIRSMFNLQVDCINTNQLQLLNGSKINSYENRKKYKMLTKWRLLENCYGIYCGHTAIEAEEIVTQTNTFSFEENLICRSLNWLIQMSWTLRRHDLLITLLQSFGINAVDFFLKLITDYKRSPTPVKTLFENFFQEARDELFRTKTDLISYYSSQKQFDLLREGGFKKLNTHYSGRVLQCNKDFIEYLVLIAIEMIEELSIPFRNFRKIISECARFLMHRNIEVSEILKIEKDQNISKEIEFRYDFLQWDSCSNYRSLLNYYNSETSVHYKFYVDKIQIKAIKNHMNYFSGLSTEYQLRKLHEPYYGINKNYLLFRIKRL